jgi:hypothetical protein
MLWILSTATLDEFRVTGIVLGAATLIYLARRRRALPSAEP